MTAPTDAERALEVVRRHAPRYPGYYSILAKDIAAALPAVRADERERAARIAETAAASAEGFNDVARNFAPNIADAIRRQEG